MASDDNSKSTNEDDSSPLPFILPFIVYMIIASRADVQPDSIDDISVTNYVVITGSQVIMTIGLTLWFFKKYLQDFPLKIDIWGFIAGLIGFFLWVGICNVGLESRLLSLVGLESWMPERIGFNPWAQISSDTTRNLFLVLRFTMLALMVPIIEELFLRGWLIRYFEDPDWRRLKLADIGMTGVYVTIIYAVATHPGEVFAAIIWFTMVTGLMIWTGKFWNCVVAHAITNLLLGIYVVNTGNWGLW